MFSEEIRQKFEDNIAFCPMSGCWLWTAGCFDKGYGSFNVPGRRSQHAHRISWELYRGAIPDGLWVLHKCDVRQCVNPDHLFLGTHADNMADMARKGRSALGKRNGVYTRPESRARGARSGAHTKPERRRRGEDHGHAKLTENAVREILASSASGVALARRFGVRKNAIYDVRNRRKWTHVQ